ncbi:MAG: site-specific DNA-methyltransferase [Bacteroidetes bacterium]|nr:MAG: site-specific DNA-methyltransferase [Bacteroidota bacterium]
MTARAPRNRTITLGRADRLRYRRRLLTLTGPAALRRVVGRTILQDAAEAAALLPARCADLLILDPPYNLTKEFGSSRFTARSSAAYEEWMETWFPAMLRLLKPTASVYICGDWRSSAAVERVAGRHLIVRNRITWEREKGRGAAANWKNASEDIWFCTVSGRYTFDVEAVKMKRRVLAPYTAHGAPKDWKRTDDGDFRLTHPSNLWTDLTVPFWSMPENTDHPTQKPEKLAAKLILASSRPGDVVLDPFLGSGTTSVAAKKLGRRFIGIERDETYACLAEKRLAAAERGDEIQGFRDGVFWERNSR